jgi:serine/threonine-protein kinase
MANLSGTELGRYKVMERLGRGGMAEVYKGYHQKLDRHVAIKVLHSYLAEGEDFLARFEREARSVANLRHTNIVQIHDFDMADENYYMVMELVDGGTLEDLLKSKQDNLDLNHILEIVERVSEALDYAHNQGIVHRDIKPSNILIDHHGGVFLTDFGIAKMISGNQFTATGALIGTPAYMSPEQCNGEEISTTSDVYSLGVILFEMLTGQQPFEAETPLSILQKQITAPVPLLHNYRQDLPPVFEKIVARSLAKDPARRYQSAGEMVVDLRGAVEEYLREAETVEPDKTTLETVVMQPEDLEEDAIVEPTVEMKEDEPEAVPKVHTAVEPEKPKIEKVQPKIDKKPTKTGLKKPIPWKIIAPAAVVVLIVIILFATGTLGGNSCNSSDSCFDLAREAMEVDDFDLALDYFNQAADLVPPDEHQPYAFLWCERGGLLEAMGRLDEAGESFEICGAWERGE